jgi:TatD DNase family protein
MDLNQLLLETDAPYLTPQIKRWETNYPANIKYIYDFVAEQLNIDQDKLWKIIKENCMNLYFK